MALIKCPECNHDVSEQAAICPNCGFGVNKYLEEQKMKQDSIKEAVRIANEIHSIETPPQQPTVQTKKSMDKIVIVICIAFGACALLCCLIDILKGNLDSNTTSKGVKSTCEWCGKEEVCKQYYVTSLDGYNRDGSFKYENNFYYFGDDCINEAKEKGVKYGWINFELSD